MSVRATVAHVHAASEEQARDILAKCFPDAGLYEVATPFRTLEVRFSAAPALASDPLAVWGAIFKRDGDYLVKAVPAEARAFDAWFYERLLQESRQHAGSFRELVLRIVDDLVRGHRGSLLSDEPNLATFERLLFDFRQAVRWSVAAPVPPEIRRRLEALGFGPGDVTAFPGIAYKLGLIERRLSVPGMRWDWADILQAAAQAPLTRGDEAAIALATQRAGTYLTPVLLRDVQGIHLAALDREQARLRTMTAEAVRREVPPRDFARQLYKQFNEEGVWRDWDRVARTEIQEARLRGSWAGDRRARQWTPDTLVFRTLSATPCNGCLRLYKTPGGEPKLYRVGDVEAQDAEGPNRGSWRDWHVRIGPTHPNCLDSPWQTFTAPLRAVWEKDAPKWAAEFRRRKLEQEEE